MTYTASQIARALGITPRAVRLCMAGILPDGISSVSGNDAPAWSIGAMPAALQLRLEKHAEALGFRNSVALLQHAPHVAPVKSKSVRDGLAPFAEIHSYVSACRNPAELSRTEQRCIWNLSFEHYFRLVNTGWSEKSAARVLRDFLFAAVPSLSKSRDGLLKAFQRKLAEYSKSAGDPKALRDKREDNGGDSFEFPQADLDLIESLIIFQYGEFAPAWRHALESGKLSETTRARYRLFRSRSHVPRKLKGELGDRPLYLYKLHRRRRDFNSDKAHFDLIYDGLHTLDCISADDVTLPVYFWHQSAPNAKPTITRGQCLVFIDLVSKRVLGWSLQPDSSYNAMVIYTQTAKVFSSEGVPKALLFERGIWERSKLVTGSAPFSVTEVTQGLKEFGVEFFHAITPEGKTEIEGVMGLIQNLMEGEPGYCGRDERRDRPDSIKKQLAEIQSANGPDPSKYFYSFEQWNGRLTAIFTAYNAKPQGGKHMQGRSPDEAYRDRWNVDDPPAVFGPAFRYLFAHAKYKKLIGPDGFSITSGNRTFKYFGPELEAYVGYEALVWFNPESPEIATVTDLNRKNPVCIPLHTGVPRLERLTNPDSPILSDACERREGQVKGIVARYNVLKSKFEMPQRRLLLDAQAIQVAKLGAEIDAKQTKIRAARDEQEKQVRKSSRLARELGIPPELGIHDRETTEFFEELKAARANSEVGEGL